MEIDKELRRGGDKTLFPSWLSENEFELKEEQCIIREIEAKAQQMDILLAQKKMS